MQTDRDTRSTGDPNTRSFGELFSQLAGDLGLLVQQEVALAKKEFQGALIQAGIGAVALAVGFVDHVRQRPASGAEQDLLRDALEAARAGEVRA